MVAAAVAAGVAVAATAASAALSATQGGPDTPSLKGVGGYDPREARAREADFRLMGQERTGLERASWEQNLLMPSLYQEAGYTAQYDQGSIDAAADLRRQSDTINAARNQARSQLQSMGPEARRAALAGLSGVERRRALKDFRQTKKGFRRQLKSSRRQADPAEAAAADAEASAGRITGFTKGRLGTADDQAFEDALRSRALNAATTGNSNDPRLNRELDEEEGGIRARLARQFGADYENTTGGQMALNGFRQRKAESLADFGRKDLALAGQAQDYESSLVRNSAGRMSLALSPSQARQGTANTFGDLSERYRGFETLLQRDRLAQYGSEVRQSDDAYAAKVQKRQAITGSLNQLASGASGAGMAFAGGGAPSYSTGGGNVRQGQYTKGY